MEELKKKATELGIKFDKIISETELKKLIVTKENQLHSETTKKLMEETAKKLKETYSPEQLKPVIRNC